VRIFKRVLAGLAVCILAAGCVSTSTGVEKAEPDDRQAAELNYELGARYYNNGKYDVARDRLLLALEFDPTFATAYSTLGLVYEGLDNKRLAVDAYEKAVDLAPKDARIQNTYAVFLCRNGEYDDAAKHFKRAAEVVENDNSEITLTNAGVCLIQKPDLAQAESFFRAALDVRPNYGEALLQMCLLKHQQNDDLVARAFLQRYLGTNKPSAAVLYLGLQIEESLGDESAREEYSSQILREFPESREARRILGNS
jgi:type IV pilus assembly protein PilF